MVQSDNATEPLGRLLRMWARVTMDRFRHSSPSTINRFEKHGASARLVAAIEGSLARLQVAHVDLLLVHSPCAHGIMRPGEPELRAAVWVGLGRIVALHHPSSALHQIH